MWCGTSQCKRTGNPCAKLNCDTHSCGNDKPFLCLQGPQKVVVPQKNTGKKNNLVPNGVTHRNVLDLVQQNMI